MKLRGYIAPGEQVILGTLAHPLTLLPAVCTLFVSAAIASFASSVMPSSRFLGYSFSLLALWLFIVTLVKTLRWATTAYLLTNHRLVIQTGFLRVVHDEIPLTTVEGVQVSEPALRAGENADLTVYSLGRARVLRRVPRARAYSQHIYRAQQAVH